jgi:hypothetical protein
MQSMYAPEFSSHTKGLKVELIEQKPFQFLETVCFKCKMLN